MFSKNTLRLTQFNVENLFLNLDTYNGQDLRKITEAEWKSFTSATTPNKSLKKTFELAQAVREINPDILMLNEVGGLESLQNFNHYFLADDFDVLLKEGNSQRGIDVGYLVRKTLSYKGVLISHKNRPLNFLYPHETQTPSGGKSHYFSRDVAELRLFAKGENSPRLVILLVHLKSKLDSDRIDSEGRLRRAAELKTLIEIYNEVRSELAHKTPVIVSGDFNGVAWPQSQAEPEFLPLHENSDLIESLSSVGTPADKRFSQVQISPNGNQQFLQLDYVFVSPDMKGQLVPNETFIYRFKNEMGDTAPIPKNIDERSRLPSDHYPVVVTLTTT